MITQNTLGLVDDAVSRARAAQSLWERVPLPRRLDAVRRLRRLIADRADPLCQAVTADIGKNAEETLGGELLPLAEACLFLERRAKCILKPRRVPLGLRPWWLWRQSDTVHRRPRGVVGIIGTWNYPLFLNGVQLVQALSAGNAVVWKPSEVAPASAEILHQLFQDADLPPELIQRLPATREMGPLLADAAIDHVVFTGSAEVGRRLAARLGQRLVSSTLELSGCDAFIVLDDADVALAARAAWFGTTLNRGQTCLAVRRVFAHRSLYQTLQTALREQTIHAPPCRLVLPGQREQAERLVDEALAEGAVRLTSAQAEAGMWPPTVLVDARPTMAVCREASFAPLMVVLPFDDVDEMLTMESQCPYALGASIFASSKSRGMELATRLRAGVVSINDVIVGTAHGATPFGGRGDSGWGSTQGVEGLLEMTVPQVASHRGGRFRPHYDLTNSARLPAQREMLHGFLESGHARTLGRRLVGWLRVLQGMMK